jgi:hypothetical protein
MLVKINHQNLSKCRQAATGRWQLARMSGVGNQKRDTGRSDNDIDFLGVRAEYSVAQIFQLDYEPTALGIDAGMDMWCADVSLDVKVHSTAMAGCFLRVLKHLNHLCVSLCQPQMMSQLWM